MQTTVQRPLQRIIEDIGDSAGVFIIGCGDCATRERFGGPEECREMAEWLTEAGLVVTGWAVPPDGGSTCNPNTARALVRAHRAEIEASDTILLLACAQGMPAVSEATGEMRIVRGTHTITGGETGGGETEVSACNFCDVCLAELTGGLCPHAFCPKGLLNGPCGGAQGGRCEVFPSRQCVWELIYRRLKRDGRLDVLMRYQHPKDFGVSDDED